MCFLRLLYCCCCCRRLQHKRQQDSHRSPLPDVQLQQLSPDCRLAIGDMDQGQRHSLQAAPQNRITSSTFSSWSCGDELYDADEHDDERTPSVWKAWWLQGATLNEEILRNPSSIVA
ncbi:GL14205 [Drosophila persimilis]|uniref:GL14205 n=1 Tax=Drosophila persimilis TaxID=7234 RepID=B4GTV0_DROPE|nr:GL14205 [Drosophila persimilis]